MNEFSIAQIVLDSLRDAINNGAYPKHSVALWADSWGFQDFWMFLLTLGLFAGVVFQIRFNGRTLREAEHTRQLEIGSVEIDFPNVGSVYDVPAEDGINRKFKAIFSVFPSGKTMTRIISYRLDFSRQDFMMLGKDWADKIKSFETASHKVLKPGERHDLTISTDEVYSPEEVEEIKTPEKPPFITVRPLCLHGTVKYNNSAGETWNKPFIYRFQWDEYGTPFAIPWGTFVKPEKLYPSKRSKSWEFHMNHPRLSRILRFFKMGPL